MCVLLCMQIYQFKIMYFLRRENPFTLKNITSTFMHIQHSLQTYILQSLFFLQHHLPNPTPSSIRHDKKIKIFYV